MAIFIHCKIQEKYGVGIIRWTIANLIPLNRFINHNLA